MAAFKTVPGNGGNWHVYPDGRRVFVRTANQNQQFGQGMASLVQQGIGYNAQTGQYTQNTSAAPDAGPAGLVDDAASAAARAQAAFQRTQAQGQLDTQGRYDKQDLAEALQRMNAQRPKDEQSTREGANQQGLFYSGQLGKRLDDLAITYAQRQGDQQKEFDRREEARKAARAAIEAGAPLEDAAISAALAERRIAGDTEAADAGALVRRPETPRVVPQPAVAKLPAVRRPQAPRQQQLRPSAPRRRYAVRRHWKGTVG